MGGLLVLLFLGLYLLLVYTVVRKAKPVWLKALAALLFALIPTADAVYGRVKLAQICAIDGGLRIKKTVEHVEGFYYGELIPDDDWVRKLGYKFVESKSLSNGIIRKERNENGDIALLKNVHRKSAFGFGHRNDDLTKTYRYDELYIYELATNEKMATLTNITFRGGWVERLVASLFASTPNSEGCQLETFGDLSLIKSVLKK